MLPKSREKGPGAERGSGEAVIKETPSPRQVKGSSLGQPCGFVGTNPGLVIRRLANPTCAPVVALTPCLLAKPILKEMCTSETGEGRSLAHPSDGSIASRTQGTHGL